MGLPNTTYVDKFVTDGNKQPWCIKNFYTTMLTRDVDDDDHIIRVPTSDFFLDHRKELESARSAIQLSEKYFYRPKLLSYELYDTTEMWLSLLRVNNMRNVTEFHHPVLIIYNPNSVKTLIDIFFKREK